MLKERRVYDKNVCSVKVNGQINTKSFEYSSSCVLLGCVSCIGQFKFKLFVFTSPRFVFVFVFCIFAFVDMYLYLYNPFVFVICVYKFVFEYSY